MGDCFQFILGGSVEEEKPPKSKKVGPFEINIRYLHTGPGLVKSAQAASLWIAFFCAVIDTSSEPWVNQHGLFVFFTVALALGAVISSYILFTTLAGLRGEEFCGVSWRFVDLLYFGVFGALFFLGSCLAANKANGVGNLTAAVAFAFLSVVTFLASFVTAWRSKADENEENKDAKNDEIREDVLPPGIAFYSDDFDLESNLKFEEENGLASRERLRSSRASLRGRRPTEDDLQWDFLFDGDNNTLERRRRFSASDKDSAYSESIFSPQDGGINPPHIRRASSVHNFDLHQMLRMPPAHMKARTLFHENQRRRRKNSVSFPQELTVNSLPKANYNYDGGRTRGRTGGSDTESTATQLPVWLRAALEDDDIIQNKKADFPIQSRRKSIQNGEFLFQSDDESIQLPRYNTIGGPQRRLFSTISNTNTFDDFNMPVSNQAHNYMQQFVNGSRSMPQHQQQNHMRFPF